MPARRTLLSGATILTMGPDGSISRGDILIEEGGIVDVGRNLVVQDADGRDLSGLVVTPGFVNAHMHTWQTLLRGLAPDRTLRGYFSAIHDGLGPVFTPDDIRISTLRGALDQMAGGVTTLFD